MKSKLEEIVNNFNGKFENNEITGVNAVAEYYTDYAVQDFNEIENLENIANIVNENLETSFEKEDIEKIGKIVEAEMNGDIENVGWDKENNEIDMDKINEIYNENKEVLDEAENPFVENLENKEKTENVETEEDKQSLIENIAEYAFSEMTDNLKNSENILDSATGEMYDRWRQEFLEEKENEKMQEIEEAFEESEQDNEQEADNDKNIEQEAQETGQKEQNEAEFAEAQAKEATEVITEIDTGISI